MDGRVGSVFSRVVRTARDRPDDSGASAAIRPLDRAKLTSRHLMAAHFGQKSACSPSGNGPSFGLGMTYERLSQVTAGSRAWPPKQLWENPNLLFHMFFSRISICGPWSIWPCHLPRRDRTWAQADGTQMNITLTNHQQHGPRNNMGDNTERAQRDARFADIFGCHARSRVGADGVAQDIQLGLRRPSSKPVGHRVTASPVPLTGWRQSRHRPP